MKKKIGCLHAHYSNIEYIQNATLSDEFEFIHFVDSGLMNRITCDNQFDEEKAKTKVLEQIEWIAQSNVDAILLTCTNYIALLDESKLAASIPIIKIDEPFFQHVLNIAEPQVLLFTNPATVEGTMRRLHEYAVAKDKPVSSIEIRIIENTFELMMQGKKKQYAEQVSAYINNALASESIKHFSVAQLSMADAAAKVEDELNVKIGNPLHSLLSFLTANDSVGMSE